MHPISPNHPHSQSPRVPSRTPAPPAAPSVPLHSPPAGQGVNTGGRVDPFPTSPASSRGGELSRPLGDRPARQGTDGQEQGAQRPGFGSSTVRKLRGTEQRLTQALDSRGERDLLNSMDSKKILKTGGLVNFLGLGSVFPLPGMKREMKAIIETYNAKFPGLEARMFHSVEKAMRTACNSLAPGQTLRGIGIQQGVHAVAMEFRCHLDGGISLIVLEPLGYPVGIADPIRNPRHNRDGRIDAALVCGLDVQKDLTSCAGFTKDFLKEFHRHGAEFEQLHRDTRTWLRGPEAAQRHGLLDGVKRLSTDPDAPVLYMSPPVAPNFLPLPLFKNLQSTHVLARILNNRPSAFTEPINARPVSAGPGMVKTGETIPERLHRLTGKEWIYRNPDTGVFGTREVSEGDKRVPMAENYRRMHGKAAEYGETGRVQPGRASP